MPGGQDRVNSKQLNVVILGELLKRVKCFGPGGVNPALANMALKCLFWSQLFVPGHTHLFQFSSVQFSRSVVSDSLRPHESQHARPSCPSPTPRVHPNPCPSSRWCHPTISSSVVPLSSCPRSFWQNVVHWRREWQTTSVFLPWEPLEQYEKTYLFTPSNYFSFYTDFLSIRNYKERYNLIVALAYLDTIMLF